MIKNEEEKNHRKLAKELRSIMENYNSNPVMNFEPAFQYLERMPKDTDRQSFLMEIKYSKNILEDVILSKENLEIINDVVDDYYKSSRLKAYNLKPNTKLLFCGPPGCGKTLTAKALAGQLQLPLLYTKLDAIISSYLGDTASNLRRVFEYINQGRWVVFFDEFDAIGKSRDDSNEHGEIKRVVNSFLQIIDTYEGESIIIAATNHQGLLDRAVWRRFDEIIFFDTPSKEEIERLIKLKLRTFPQYDINFEGVISELCGMSHSEIENICNESMKICVKNNVNLLDTNIFEKAINKQKRRSDIYSIE
ncbi:MAG: ATP-binding protein [Fermentimonas sp.]|nr:ATP-binding protein [Fermentimonas sp.]